MAIQLEILQKTKKTADPEQKDQFHVLCFLNTPIYIYNIYI